MINYAIGFAHQFKCRLTFFHSALTLLPTSITPPPFYSSIEKELKLKEDLLIKKVALSCHRLGINPSSLHLEYEVNFGGNVIEDVVELIRGKGIDLLMMSTHGNTGFKKWILGSATSSIISKVHVPVLAIPVNYRYRTIRELVYASDLQNAINEIREVKGLAKQLDSELEMINFNYGASHADPGLVGEIKAEGVPYKELRLNVEHTLADELRKYMKSRKDSVLCVFSKHKALLKKLFVGSNTNSLLEGLDFPLLSCEVQPSEENIGNENRKVNIAG